MTALEKFNNTWAGDLGKSPTAMLWRLVALCWCFSFMLLTLAEVTTTFSPWVFIALTAYWLVDLSLHVRSYLIRTNLRIAELEARVRAMEPIRA